jgi:FixJ family two-component response regulator
MAQDPVTTNEKVFVVDDEEDVRDALKLLMASEGLPAEAFGSAEAFLSTYTPGTPGCLVLDVRMPGMNGMVAQQTLRERGIELPIIFISGHGDIPMAVRAVQEGALDFLEKPFSDDALLDCVRRALEQDRQQRAEAAEREAVESCLATLTPREREVMDKLIEGKVNKIIARELDASTRTVEIHRARVLQKMEVDNAAQLVRRVVGVTGEDHD